MTSYAIEHYHEIKNEHHPRQIIYKLKTGTYKRSSSRGLCSFKVLRLTLQIQQRPDISEEDKLLSSIFQEPLLLCTPFYDSEKMDFDRIETLYSILQYDYKYLDY